MTGVYTFKFKIDPKTFRQALYFNTFSRHRGQFALVALAWAAGLVLMLLNLVGGIEMSSVMQLCYMVILATMPLLIFSCEHGYRNYRNSDLSEKERTVSISEEWVKFRVSGSPDSEKIGWHNIMAVYELPDRFIIYRDSDLMVVLPKDVMNESELSKVSSYFSENLGRSFHRPRYVAPMLAA
ncbi:MAG: YcxB family protein [Atopobiaceae bacterium]|jgi:hypothetical protein|nr:YcxB family protein [Atopobiaceae bacterium]MCI2172628.1 YcxB family protein [Atopobiaceae bacterium]MCI2206935.1 YcxB family protein [Atopobiaceae bacterium]